MTPPSEPRQQLVAQTDVGERAAHHHLVVAAPGAERIEVPRLDVLGVEVLGGRAVALDRAGRRDVVGGDAVAEQRQHAGLGDVGQRLGLDRQVVEERRPAHVGRALIPGEAVAGRHLERVPALVAVEHLAVGLAEHVGLDRLLDGAGDLRLVGPDVLQVHGSPCVVGAERLVVEVDVHRAGQRVGDAQRRRREVVHLHVGVDPALEVAVAREHRDDRQVLGADDVGDLGRQRPGIADAGRAPVTDEVEAELVEVLVEPGPLAGTRSRLWSPGPARS